jgi:hypothetical protein
MPKSEIERCPTCHRKRTRSNPANARYWLLLHLIADNVKPEGQSYTAEVWHNYMKQRFLGSDEFMLPNKKVVQYPKSSAGLDKDEFNTYMAAVEAWAMERNIYLDELEPT